MILVMQSHHTQPRDISQTVMKDDPSEESDLLKVFYFMFRQFLLNMEGEKILTFH